MPYNRASNLAALTFVRPIPSEGKTGAVIDVSVEKSEATLFHAINTTSTNEECLRENAKNENVI